MIDEREKLEQYQKMFFVLSKCDNLICLVVVFMCEYSPTDFHIKSA